MATATAATSVMPSPTEARVAATAVSATITAEPTGVPTLATAAPTSFPTITPPAGPANGQGRLVFQGCIPQASQVQVEFLPLAMWDAAGAATGVPSGPSVRVGTTAAQDAPGVLTFQPPSTTDAGRIYQLSVHADDPRCSLDARPASTYWLAGAGKDVLVPLVAPGESRLEVSNNGDKPPIPLAVVKGAFVQSGGPAEYFGAGIDPPNQFDGWETQIDFYGSAEGRKQRFRWSTDLEAAGSAVLQVGMMPFPNGYHANSSSPAGLLASWPVDCVDCEFVVDLSSLPAPKPKVPAATSAKAPGSPLDTLGQIVSTALDAIGNLFGDLAKKVAGLFGGSEKPTAQPLSKKVEIEVPTSKVTLSASNMAGSSVATPVNPILFTTFYFRVLPLKDGIPAGAGSNAVIMHWAGDSPPDINVSIDITPTPTPVPSAYKTEIVSYHGIIPPLNYCTTGEGLYNSFVVLQDAWWDKSKIGFHLTTNSVGNSAPYLKTGDVLCEPKPKEPDIFEKIGEWVSGAWNWVAEAYGDLKSTVVSAVGFFIPDSLCSDSCVGFFLDAALVSMGIPPDIPNLDQLMGEGFDYIAQQTVAQIGLPPEVIQQTGPYAGMLLSEAEAKFKEEAQAKLKEGIQKGVKQIQLGYADSVGWLPKGVPVRPNSYQPPGMSIKVTRMDGVAGGEDGCTARTYDVLTIEQNRLDNPPTGYANSLSAINQKQALVPGKNYDLFVDLKLPVPPLAPGSSVTIPMSFKPNVYQSGWNPWGSVETADYFKAWAFMHMLGDVQLSVSGCGSAELDVVASSTYGAAQQ